MAKFPDLIFSTCTCTLSYVQRANGTLQCIDLFDTKQDFSFSYLPCTAILGAKSIGGFRSNAHNNQLVVPDIVSYMIHGCVDSMCTCKFLPASPMLLLVI